MTAVKKAIRSPMSHGFQSIVGSGPFSKAEFTLLSAYGKV